MSELMNDAQKIFTVFYGLYFAATISMTRVFQPFNTPAIYKVEGRAIVRFLVSFLLLNIVPLAYFVFVFRWIGSLADFQVRFWPMLLLLFLSLAGFGFYRIYFGIMLLYTRNSYFFYGSDLPPCLKKELERRAENKTKEYQKKVRPHLIPGILWVFVTLLLGWFWTK